MATTPLNTGTLFQGALATSTLLLTGCDGGTTTAVGVGVAAVSALGVGAYAIHQRWSRMQDNRALPAGPGVAGLLQTQNAIPDDVIRSNLGDELIERYTVLGDAAFAKARTVLAANIFQDWDNQGRPADASYPQLRGFIPEALIEARISDFIGRIQGKSTEQAARLLSGLQLGEANNRSRRWAPRNVEESIAAALQSAYSAFGKNEDADVRGKLAATVVKEAFRAWLKESPSLMDKPGPATPVTGEFIQAAVHNLMAKLAQKANDPRFTSLLRDLRRDERRRTLGAQTIFPRLQVAVRELKSLSLETSQIRFSDGLIREQLRRTMEALKDFPEAMSREDWEKFAALEGKEGDERAVRELTGRLPALQAKADEALLKEEATLAQRLRWLQAAVAGERSVAGLDAASVGTLHPLLPDWAGSVTVRQGDKSWKMVLNADGKVLDAATGLEISFSDGGFWLRDARGLSRLHPSNWLRAFAVNGRKIQAGGSWPVRNGDRMKVGVDVEIEFLLPEEPPLERVKLRIARIASLEDMARFLRDEGQSGAASQVEAYLEHGDDFSDLPKAGGLAAKIAELVLRREAGKLHEKYFLSLSYDAAETKMTTLARSVSESASASELAQIARESGLADADDIAAAISRVFNSTDSRSLEGIPAIFGFRDRVSFFVREGEKKMKAQIAVMEAENSRLSGDLRNANEGITNRDKALAEGVVREENLNHELEEARKALVAQEQAAKAEKARLKAEHAAALEAWNQARANLIDQHEQARMGQDATHRVALAKQERNHGVVVERMKDERAALVKEHEEAVAAAGKAHASEIERIKAAHTEAIRLKDGEISSAAEAHKSAVANMREQYRTATEQTLGDHDAAMDALKAEHAEALRAKGAEHEAALVARDTSHKEAMGRLEEARAAWERRSGELEASKTTLERELGTQRARAAAAEDESRQRLERIAALRTDVADAAGDRDTFKGQAENYKSQFESMRGENDRLLNEVIEPLERRLAERTQELRENGAMLAEIEVAVSALESVLKIESQVLSTDDYLKRAKRIRESLEARLTGLAESEAALAARLAAAPVTPPAATASDVLPIPHEDIPVVDIPFEVVADEDLILTKEQVSLGEHESVVLEPDRVTVIGSGPDSDIHVEQGGLAPVHFELRRHDDKWQIRDLGSPQGTYVEASKLRGDWQDLSGGEWIFVGRKNDRDFQFNLNAARKEASLERGPFGRAEQASTTQTIHDETTQKIHLPQMASTEPETGAVLAENSRVDLEKGRTYVVGRGKDADILIDDRNVSRSHFEIKEENGEWVMRDVGSSFGTRIGNGSFRLDGQWTAVADGTDIYLGSYADATFRIDKATGQASLRRGKGYGKPDFSFNATVSPITFGTRDLNLSDNDEAVGREHLLFAFENDAWFMTDLGEGGYGTLFNGTEISSGQSGKPGLPQPLKTGDWIKVGIKIYRVLAAEDQLHLIEPDADDMYEITAKLMAGIRKSAAPAALSPSRPFLSLNPSHAPVEVGRAAVGGDESVAPNHVRFIVNPETGVWGLMDLGSGFPTYTSDGLMKPGAAFRIRSNDWCIMGRFGFAVVIDEQNQIHLFPMTKEATEKFLAQSVAPVSSAAPVSQAPQSQTPWMTFNVQQSMQTLGFFQLNHPSVADHHVQFVFNPENGRWFLRDMGSGKPTYFKGVAVNKVQGELGDYCALQTKDWFIIGEFGFNVTIDAQNNLQFWPVDHKLVAQKLKEIGAAQNGAGPSSQTVRAYPPPQPSPTAVAPQPATRQSPLPPPLPVAATRISRSLKEAMARDARPDDDGIPAPSSSGPASGLVTHKPTFQDGELNMFGAALVHMVSKRGNPGDRKPLKDLAEGYEIILENAGLFSIGATHLVTVYRHNGSVFVRNAGESVVVLTRPDRPNEKIPVVRGEPTPPDVPSGSVIQVAQKHMFRVRYT